MLYLYETQLAKDFEVRDRMRQAERERLVLSTRPRRQGLLRGLLRVLPHLIGYLLPRAQEHPKAGLPEPSLPRQATRVTHA